MSVISLPGELRSLNREKGKLRRDMVSLSVHKRKLQRGFGQSLLYRALSYSEKYSVSIVGKSLFVLIKILELWNR